jgi:hypothetical protein
VPGPSHPFMPTSAPVPGNRTHQPRGDEQAWAVRDTALPPRKSFPPESRRGGRNDSQRGGDHGCEACTDDEGGPADRTQHRAHAPGRFHVPKPRDRGLTRCTCAPAEGERTQPGPQHQRLAAIAVGDADRRRQHRIRAADANAFGSRRCRRSASASGTARLVTRQRHRNPPPRPVAGLAPPRDDAPKERRDTSHGPAGTPAPTARRTRRPATPTPEPTAANTTIIFAEHAVHLAPQTEPDKDGPERTVTLVRRTAESSLAGVIGGPPRDRPGVADPQVSGTQPQ